MTDDPLVDHLARVIAAAIWRPQPAMSNDIWERLPAQQRRHATDAAIAVLELMNNEARVQAAAAWLMADDSAYKFEPDIARRSATGMLAAADAAGWNT